MDGLCIDEEGQGVPGSALGVTDVGGSPVGHPLSVWLGVSGRGMGRAGGASAAALLLPVPGGAEERAQRSGLRGDP